VTPGVLVHAMGCTPELAVRYAPHLREACALYDISTPVRQAAFLAQIGHESGSLRFARELWGPSDAQKRYEGRADLGNTQPGDGFRYRGRGLIQTTGRHNYQRVRDRLRQKLGDAPDFEAFPESLEQPRWAALSAADFWDMKNLNPLADVGEFLTITRRINGGTNGLADRQARHKRALDALTSLAQQDQPPAAAPAAPRAAPPATPPAPAAPAPKETPMPPLLAMLGKTLIAGFAPLAAEKINRELSRHIDNPEVVEQMTTAAVETAKAVTGISDPLDAVSAARQSPEVMQRVQEQTLAKLAELAPLLEKLSELEGKAWAATEDSVDRAAARYASRGPNEWDMTQTLVLGAMAMFFALLLLVGGIAVYQAGWKEGVAAEVWAQVAGLIGFVTGVLVTVFSFRFGTTRHSGAKDVLIGELSKRVP
jgi:putative chitinase